MNWLKNIAKALINGVVDLSPNCKTAVRLQSEALEHPLPFRQSLGLRIHLWLCKWCRRYGKQITFVHDAAHSHPDKVAEMATEQLSSEAKDRIQQKIRSQLK